MRLITSIIALLIVSTNLNAQFFTKKIKGNGDIITKTRTVSNYDKIGVAGSFDIKLFKGKEGEITIKADKNLMEYIITKVKNGKLEIKTKKGYTIRESKTIVIKVPFDDISAVSIAGSGDIYSDDIIDTHDLKLSLAGSGNLNLNVSTKNLVSSIAGSGNMNLKGNSKEFTCSIAGSGNAKVHATKEVHANTAGSGDIYYTGNPSIEKTSSVGSGTIKKKN